jgi:hypothetical protein
MEEITEERTEHSTGTKKIRAPVIALAIAGVVLGGSLIAGIGSFAFAQEATGTPTAQEQATPQATDDGTSDDGSTAEDGAAEDDGTAQGEHECDKDKEQNAADSSDTSTSTSGLTF